MKHVEIMPAAAGLWLYLVYFDGRISVVGLSATRQRAEEAAAHV